MPTQAQQHTSEGALEFGQYFIAALDWSAATNDAYLLTGLVNRGCSACSREITGLQHLAAVGDRQIGGRLRLTEIKIVTGRFRTQSDRVVEAFVDQSQASVIASDGTVVASTPAESFKSLIFVSWTGTNWTVVEQAEP